MSADEIYKRLEQLFSDNGPVAPDPAVSLAADHLPAGIPAADLPLATVVGPLTTAGQVQPVVTEARLASIRPGGTIAEKTSTKQGADKAPGSLPGRRRLEIDPRRWSLAAQLVVLISLLVVSALGAATVLITRSVRVSLTEQIGAQFAFEARNHVEQIERFFLEKGGQAQTLALSNVLRTAVAASNAAYTGSPQEILAGILALDQAWRAAEPDDPFIRAIIAPLRTENPSAYELSQFLNEYSDHTELILTDQQGATVAATGLLSDYYQADERWWQAAWNDGQGAVYLSDPEFDESAGVTASLLAVPITAEDGSVIGVLRSTLVLDDLYARVTAGSAGSTRQTLLLSPTGTILFDPTGGQVSGEDPALWQEVAGLSSYFDTFASSSGTFLLGTSNLLELVGKESFPTRRTQQLADATHQLGWAAVVRQDTRDAFAGVDQIAGEILLTGSAAALLAGLVGIAIARTITRPLQALSETAAQLGSGNLAVAPGEVQGSPEVRRLNQAFGYMTAELKGLLSGLESKVADRTRDLELAAEVGKRLSSLRDLDTLLSQAAELIRARFSLYYTQIYLADPSGRRLILRAGTGPTGEQLLARGHQLPVGHGSINGQTAVDRRSTLVQDTSRSQLFLPNPLLPETRSEMAVPLLVGDRLVGVLDLQSSQAGSLSADNLPAFEALAGQLSIAIDNATLFREASRAQEQAAGRSRQAAVQNWTTFLDAVERQERVGYTYAGDQLVEWAPSASAETDHPAFALPIEVLGARVGSFQIEAEPDRSWTADERQLAESVSEQLGRHIENLRLLAEAERYQRVSESAMRRQTVEAWDGFLEAVPGQSRRYAYDGNRVVAGGPEPVDSNGHFPAFKQNLAVHGETIGGLEVVLPEGVDQLDPESRDLLTVISERLAAHIDTLRLNEQSARLLAELEATVRRLKELDLLKSSFLANMSHELRTPLNSMLGFADVIMEGLDGPLTEQMSHDLQIVQRNGRHLLHLINDVLDMARIEAGGMSLEPQRFDLGAALEEVYQITSPLAAQKNLDYRVAVQGANNLELVADRIRLNQVLLNLIGNAIKFTDEGRISVEAEELGDRVQIRVRDSGMGIPADQTAVIFEPFGQVDNSATRKTGGTGLGLPISRRLVEMHGGKIWVESAGIPGQGSTFYVDLPIESVAYEQNPIPIPQREG